MKRKLPIGVHTFREIREGGCYYVDKTPHIECLIESGKHYFLSPPRRFGKSLLVDTLKELFEGSEELFRGLHIHDRWDWSVRHPVVRFDFGDRSFRSTEDLKSSLAKQLEDMEQGMDVTRRHDSLPGRFGYLLQSLHEQTGRRVVVLVDECDKPVLDALVAGNRELARANRDNLLGFFGNVKRCDAHIRVSFFTGVINFIRGNVFSGLNNLLDITLSRRFATICGFTDAEIDAVFAPELEGLDRQLVRNRYDGYHWLGKQRVYNPFDILLLLESREFKAHWFEADDSPDFIIEALAERGISTIDLEGMIVGSYQLSVFEVEDIQIETLLFQTGHLTIAEESDHEGWISYRLDYPNRQVRESLNRSLLHKVDRNTAQNGAG